MVSILVHLILSDSGMVAFKYAFCQRTLVPVLPNRTKKLKLRRLRWASESIAVD